MNQFIQNTQFFKEQIEITGGDDDHYHNTYVINSSMIYTFFKQYFCSDSFQFFLHEQLGLLIALLHNPGVFRLYQKLFSVNCKIEVYCAYFYTIEFISSISIKYYCKGKGVFAMMCMPNRQEGKSF
jgi:hypothetical protein